MHAHATSTHRYVNNKSREAAMSEVHQPANVPPRNDPLPTGLIRIRILSSYFGSGMCLVPNGLTANAGNRSRGRMVKALCVVRHRPLLRADGRMRVCLDGCLLASFQNIGHRIVARCCKLRRRPSARLLLLRRLFDGVHCHDRGHIETRT